MDNGYQENNRTLNLIVVALFGILILGIILFVVARMSGKGTTSLSRTFAQNIRYPFKANDTELYFYTGHGFASLDTSTNTTKQLGATRVMPNTVSDIQIGEQGAIVVSAEYTAFDALGAKVKDEALGSDIKRSRLWYVPFNGEVTEVDANVGSAYFDRASNTIYYSLWNRFEGSGIFKAYSLTTGKTTFVSGPELYAEDHRIVYAQNGTMYYLSTLDGRTTLSKVSNKTIQSVVGDVFGSSYGTAQGAFIMLNENQYVAVKPSTKDTTLITYDIGASKEKVVNSNFVGTLNRADNTSVIANGTEGNRLTFTRIDGSDKVTTESVDQREGNTSSTFAFGDNLLTINLSSQAALVSDNKSQFDTLPEIKSGGLEKAIDTSHANGNLYDVSILLNNAATSNTYNVLIYKPHNQNLQIFMDDVQKAGYDSNQLDFIFNKTVKRIEP